MVTVFTEVIWSWLKSTLNNKHIKANLHHGALLSKTDIVLIYKALYKPEHYG